MACEFKNKFLLKSLAVALLLALLFLPATAQSGAETRIDIKSLYLSAKGILVNSEDPMDIHSSKIIAASFRPPIVPLAGDKKREVGLLYVDTTKYLLKDINATPKTFSANIYDKNILVGSISLIYVDTADAIVWAGKALLHDKRYNAYYLQFKVLIRPTEDVTNIGEYCKENPNSEKCQQFEKCKQNPEACKNEVQEYCKNNTNDKKCVELWKEYCVKNSEDVRCKEYLKERCKENPTLEFCVVQTDEQNRTYVTANPIGPERPERVDKCLECKEACRKKCIPGMEPQATALPVEAGKCLQECIANCEPCRQIVAPPQVAIAGTLVAGEDFCGRCRELCIEGKKKCEPPYKCMSKEEAEKNGCLIVGSGDTYYCPQGVCAKCPIKPICPQIIPVAESCKDGEIVPRYDNNGCVVGYDCIKKPIKPCICPAIYEPVCGKDGNTYSNECFAKCAGVEIAYRGKCGQLKCCVPECKYIGTRSEGWYACDGLRKYANCAGDKAVCRYIGTRSEGWYSANTGELIEYASCSRCFPSTPEEIMNCPDPYVCAVKAPCLGCTAISNTPCGYTNFGEAKYCYKCPEPPIMNCPEPYKCYSRDQLPSEECIVVSDYACKSKDEVCAKCPGSYECLTKDEIEKRGCTVVSGCSCPQPQCIGKDCPLLICAKCPQIKLCEKPYECLPEEEIKKRGCTVLSEYVCPVVDCIPGQYCPQLKCAKCPSTPICPQIAPPSPEFCKDGKIVPRYDNNGCVVGYDCIRPTPVEQPKCKYLYWFDKNNRTCGYKQFCGEYMYEGLQVFETQDACEKALCSPYTCLPRSVGAEKQCKPISDTPCAYTSTGEAKYCYKC